MRCLADVHCVVHGIVMVVIVDGLCDEAQVVRNHHFSPASGLQLMFADAAHVCPYDCRLLRCLINGSWMVASQTVIIHVLP